MESNLGQCPFTLDDAFFPAVHGGKRFLDCVWVRLLFDALSLLPMGGEKNLEGMGEATIYGAKSLHTREFEKLCVSFIVYSFKIFTLRNFVFHFVIIFVILLLLKMKLAFPPPPLMCYLLGSVSFQYFL